MDILYNAHSRLYGHIVHPAVSQPSKQAKGSTSKAPTALSETPPPSNKAPQGDIQREYAKDMVGPPSHAPTSPARGGGLVLANYSVTEQETHPESAGICKGSSMSDICSLPVDG